MRIAITTTPDKAGRAAGTVRELGHHPVLIPCIDVVAGADVVLGRVRRSCERADVAMLTSARAVEVVWRRSMDGLACAAVGHRTAAAIRRHGGRVVVTGPGGADGLVDAMMESMAPCSVVWPRSNLSSVAPATRLRHEGFEVVTEAVYETTPYPASPEQVDAVVFGSPSAVDGWLLTRSIDDVAVVAIGATTARRLEDGGRAPDVVSPRTDFRSAVTALDKWRSVNS